MDMTSAVAPHPADVVEADHASTPLLPDARGVLDRWMTPKTVLLAFSLLNLVTYFDRGAIAGSLSAIKVNPQMRGKEASVSDTRSGIIVSAFMVGYIFTCPLFAALGACMRIKHIILAGMLVWSAACLGTAVSSSYDMLLYCRLLVGVGEAAFVGFTVTIIDNIAPPARRTSWIGIFYSMIPVGTAIGMACGGLASERSSVFGVAVAPWRVIFLAEVAVAMPVFFAIALLPRKYDAVTSRPSDDEDAWEGSMPAGITPVDSAPGDGGGAADPAPRREAYLPIHTASMALAKNPDYILVVIGFAMYCFGVGAISVWAIPLLAQGPLALSVSTAAIVMGASTLCGVVGSLFGGWAVDRLGGSTGLRGSAKCQLFSAAMIAVSFPCGILALLQTSLVPFLAAFVPSVLALFAITAPVNAAILSIVPAALRPYAVSYSVFFIHFLGDFPSPTIAGALSDQFGRGCNYFVDAATCQSAPTSSAFLNSRECRWLAGNGSSSGHCINIYQLRDALLIVFGFLAIAIPCWACVYVRLRRKARVSERVDDVLVVVSVQSAHP